VSANGSIIGFKPGKGTTLKVRAYVITLCVLMLTIVVGRGSAAAPLKLFMPTCGQEVTSSFRLSGNLTCPAGSDGIVIGGANLTVDLNRFTVRGEDAAGITATPLAHSAHVKNGVVRGFDEGVALSRASVISGLVITNSTVGVVGSYKSQVLSSTIASNDTGYLADAPSAPRAVISNNRFVGNRQGIVVIDGSQTTIKSNDVIANRERGIWIKDGAGHVIDGNDVSSNGNTGVSVGFSGVVVDIDASDVVTENNVIDGNGRHGYHDLGTGNTASSNRTRGNGFFVSDSDGSGLVSASSALGSDNLDLGNDEPCIGPAACDARRSKTYFKLVKQKGKGPKKVKEAFPLMTPSCGSIVNTSFRLAADVDCSTGPHSWIDVGTNGITIDLNGKTVTGPEGDGVHPALPESIGVSTATRSARIRNGVIRGFTYDVYYGPNGGTRLYDLVLTDAEVGGYEEFMISGVPKPASISRNVVVANSSGIIGSAFGDEISDNRILSNEFGIDVVALSYGAEDGPIVSGNLIAGSAGFGVLIDGYTPPGPDLYTAFESKLDANRFFGNGHGGFPDEESVGLIIGEDTQFSVISSNLFVGNASDGYQDLGASNTAKANSAYANGYDNGVSDSEGSGFDLEGAHDPVFSGNRSAANDQADLMPVT
jgi:parallel beta-helix repeat protein